MYNFRDSVTRRTLIVLTFIGAFALRVHGISDAFWMLRDQMRDWGTVLGSFHDLPLVGPATHVGGYTIGPAFYWILWVIRVVVGPWFDNLPHAGGIGQAALQSGVDALLLVALWRRTQSVATALAVVVLLVSAAFDLSLAAVIWNPVVGSTLAKCAIALVLLDWHRGSPAKVATTAAVAWAAVHAYTGAIYVTAGVFAAIAIEPLIARAWPTLLRRAGVVATVVAVLQLPYLWFRLTVPSGGDAMGAVRDSVARVVTGGAAPQLGTSVSGLVHAFANTEGPPLALPVPGLILLAASAILIVRYRRDPALLAVTVLPMALAIGGFALFLGGLDDYYYLSLMPCAVLTVVLAAAAYLPKRALQGFSIALLAGALAMVPARARLAVTTNRMPEYRVLVRAARAITRRGVPMRAVRAAFPLPPTSNAEFLVLVLGGKIVHGAPWMATIDAQGDVTYQFLGES